jgi:hypothetical protein
MKKLLLSLIMMFSVAAHAATVEVITSNNATIANNTDVAELDYDQVTSGLSAFQNANVYLPAGSNGKVIELKVTGTIDGEHNIVINPSGTDQLESDAGLDAMATSQGSARRLYFKNGKWKYLTYM